MYLDDECKKCICTTDFSGPSSASCNHIYCGVPLHYNSEINRGCSVVHISSGKCCPIPEFVCPDEVAVANPVSSSLQKSPSAEYCTFGENQVAVGDDLRLMLEQEDPCLTCTCTTPPHVTCVKEICPDLPGHEVGSCSYMDKPADQCCAPIQCVGIPLTFPPQLTPPTLPYLTPPPFLQVKAPEP